MNSYQVEYLAIWKVAFAEFLGWNEAQTFEWATPFLKDLAMPGAVLNEPPLFYVARELASRQPYYDDLSQTARWDFIREVEGVLSPGHARGFSDEYDFMAAKQAMQGLLRDGRSRLIPQ
jgi:hypothetical protein